MRSVGEETAPGVREPDPYGDLPIPEARLPRRLRPRARGRGHVPRTPAWFWAFLALAAVCASWLLA